ncbi:hypothetical protein PUV54_00195 [Hyphococcus flavus]|uniref:Uncharacterized protein n=1 Tax=Hyphococcus flavus TaxID=1866326 RepID=A0AAE9ZBJ1_9PROT|nr:hypothetical protein [Hyphococcus flavus]WDI31613.1 hypothetical protein PUV54_00195 [Hyphococcus flavus]
MNKKPFDVGAAGPEIYNPHDLPAGLNGLSAKRQAAATVIAYAEIERARRLVENADRFEAPPALISGGKSYHPNVLGFSEADILNTARKAMESVLAERIRPLRSLLTGPAFEIAPADLDKMINEILGGDA